MLKETGDQVVEYLRGYVKKDIVIAAIPDAGVKVGHYIAKALDLPLEILLMQKIGHQFNKDFSIGCAGLSNRIIKWASNVSMEYVNEESERIQNKLRKKYFHYTGREKPFSLSGKIVIISDDVVFSGETLHSAISLAKKNAPEKIIAVSPIVALDAVDKITRQVQKFIYLRCLSAPSSEKEMRTGTVKMREEEVIALLRSTTA